MRKVRVGIVVKESRHDCIEFGDVVGGGVVLSLSLVVGSVDI
jgi:hypothetical protein